MDGVSTPPTDVNGIKGRTTALSSLGSFNLALPGQALDADADGVVDIPDNCPSVPNGVDQVAIPDVGNQTDTDGDLVADACDNCRTIPNPRVAADFLINNPWATLTGGQRDDDQDGFGNACGADFTGTGALIGSGDLSVFRALRGKAAGPKCPTCPLPCSAGTAGSCF